MDAIAKLSHQAAPKPAARNTLRTSGVNNSADTARAAGTAPATSPAG